jgi:hypothetical protein
VNNNDERTEVLYEEYREHCAKAAEERLRVQKSKAPIAWERMTNEEIVVMAEIEQRQAAQESKS